MYHSKKVELISGVRRCQSGCLTDCLIDQLYFLGQRYFLEAVAIVKSLLTSRCIVKEGNVLFNDALNTFYLRLYSVRYIVKENSYY